MLGGAWQEDWQKLLSLTPANTGEATREILWSVKEGFQEARKGATEG